jgi:SEC-C motif-containing protein
MEDNDLCPCCSGKGYAECCKVFHEGILPENALQLMRSRYSAYASDLPDYIVATTHPANPNYNKDFTVWKKDISKFSSISIFRKLDILDFHENGNLATVTFTAYISQGNNDVTFTEKSNFEKIRGRWLYRDGEIFKSV